MPNGLSCNGCIDAARQYYLVLEFGRKDVLNKATRMDGQGQWSLDVMSLHFGTLRQAVAGVELRWDVAGTPGSFLWRALRTRLIPPVFFTRESR